MEIIYNNLIASIIVLVVVLAVIFYIWKKVSGKTDPSTSPEVEEYSASQKLNPYDAETLNTLNELADKGAPIPKAILDDAASTRVIPVETTEERKQIVDSLADLPFSEFKLPEATANLDPVVAADPNEEPEEKPAADVTNSSPHKGAAVGKFPDAVIRAIRTDARSDEVIAAERGVSKRTVTRIRNYETYSHVR